MVDFMKYIQQAPSENKKLTRGYSVDESTLSIGFDSRPTKYDFDYFQKTQLNLVYFHQRAYDWHGRLLTMNQILKY